jgi:hypothetical protein
MAAFGVPMRVTDKRKVMFDQLPMECHVDLILGTPEAMFGAKACADIITMGLDREIFCQLEGWQRLMNTWKDRCVQMTVREFEEDGDEADCFCFPGSGNPRGMAGGEGCSGGADKRRETAPN